MSKPLFSTFVEVAQERARSQPLQPAYSFLSGHDESEEKLNYLQLDQKAKAIAVTLLEKGLAGQRALLLYAPGLDYITAFYGCLYAGVVAVPVYPPDPSRLGRTLPRLLNIIESSQAHAILTTSPLESLVRENLRDSFHKDLIWVSTDTLPSNLASSYVKPAIEPNTLAFLQYTSGSTSAPRGVMLTHNNLLCNLSLAQNDFWYGEKPVGVCWVPPYHDMGLIGGILQPLLIGFEVTLMSPLDFLSNPFLWLKKMSEKKATISAGPNFSYDLCVRRITLKQRESLDLSHWVVAVNGAEPVRRETMEQFSIYFSPCGFKREAFFPCYGLAENTVYVSGGIKTKALSSFRANAALLEKGVLEPAKPNETARVIVGCGKPNPEIEVHVVDPHTRVSLGENKVGEIWLHHAGVSQGYWNNPEKTKETFGGFLTEPEKGPFLRTGDLGFLNNGEIFITGRQKDLIIIRGRNHYPQDIEQTFEKSHPNLRPGCVAAFSLEQEGHEQLVLIAEVKNQLNPTQLEEIIHAILKSTLAEHGLKADVIALITSKSIPKTSSGKIQRHACKEQYLSDTLELEHLWTLQAQRENVPSEKKESTDLSTQVAQILGIDTSIALKSNEPLVNFGLDSLMRQELITALEDRAGVPLPDLKIDETTTLSDLQKALESVSLSSPSNPPKETLSPILDARFESYPAYIALQEQLKQLEAAGLKNPFFTEHDGIARDTTAIHGQSLINFSSYNYVGLSGHPLVSKAAKDAIDQYGTSVSASRLVSGERPVHTALEHKIAKFIGVEDSIVYVSGHATNVSTIGHLFGPGDLIVHDSLSHDSILQGCKLSGAKSLPFPHNDWQALERILAQHRPHYQRALVVIEGIYSMDGDIPDLAKYVDVKNKHQAFLMVDEAHSIGVLGKRGKGLAEYANVDPKQVDLWMGTLSKSFASCGGYIAGTKAMVDYLRYSSPSFVYSVGISPPNAAASLKAIEILEQEPERTERLRHNSDLFLKLCKEHKLNTGLSAHSPIIPVIIGNSMQTLQIAEAMLKGGVNVRPIIYPAVEDKLSRLRFFITSSHTDEQIQKTVQLLAKEVSACASL